MDMVAAWRAGRKPDSRDPQEPRPMRGFLVPQARGVARPDRPSGPCLARGRGCFVFTTAAHGGSRDDGGQPPSARGRRGAARLSVPAAASYPRARRGSSQCCRANSSASCRSPPAVVDAFSLSRQRRDRCKELIEQHGCRWELVHLHAPRNTLRNRLRVRNGYTGAVGSPWQPPR
ncbi:hypothetical protein CIB93_01525 [Streptomyces sp. WZ.A104]|nr:hypothetical protein CIB93_01525 [Streptomyces sp. WZ.A104]